MEKRSIPLPLAAAPANVRLDEEAAARLGIVPSGPARAQGLIDRFGRRHRTLRISITERCNLRCSYCMPEEGVALLPREEILTFEEIERLARLFVQLGIERIRLTGGEPLVRRELGKLARKLGALKQPQPRLASPPFTPALPSAVALAPPPPGAAPRETDSAATAPRLHELLMTSNALLLEPILPELLDAGLDGINISLDTLRPERFERVTRRAGLAQTLSAIRAAARAPQLRLKINAVAMRGVNDDEVCELAAFVCGELGVELRYIEYMPFDGNHWSESSLYPAEAIRADLARRYQLEPLGLDQDGAGTAQLHALTERATGRALPGRVGIISSMSEPFCATCSRLRITADGKLRWCLLDEGELDLRGPMRAGASDSALIALIEEGLERKAAGHAPAPALLEAQAKAGARAMIRIGG